MQMNAKGSSFKSPIKTLPHKMHASVYNKSTRPKNLVTISAKPRKINVHKN